MQEISTQALSEDWKAGMSVKDISTKYGIGTVNASIQSLRKREGGMELFPYRREKHIKFV